MVSFHVWIEPLFRSHQDNWQPALEKLVESIGEKFSAAFDRKPNRFFLSFLGWLLTCVIYQVSAVRERFVSANMKTMRNGRLIFLSSSVTVRNYSCSRHIDSQAAYVDLIFSIYKPHGGITGTSSYTSCLPAHFFMLKLFFSQ